MDGVRFANGAELPASVIPSLTLETEATEPQATPVTTLVVPVWRRLGNPRAAVVG